MTKLFTKIILALSLSLFITACGTGKPKAVDNIIEKETVFQMHSYKVAGLSDTVVVDSVWKLMFSFNGIEELVMDKKDSVVSFKVDSALVNLQALEQEVEQRGAKILEKLN